MFAVSVTCALFVSSVLSQVIEIRDYRGKQINCVRSGLKGFGRSCGTGDNYETVFVGSIVSVTETTDNERRMQLLPEEVFLGNADGLLTVNTSQGACLGDFQAGNEWLFYLHRDAKTKTLELSYGSPSKPMADAQKEVALLRRLVQMDDSGLILGQVIEPIWNENKWERDVPVPNHRVVAKHQQSGREYAAFTDGDGYYEFEPLPPGAYRLSANASEGLRAAEGDAVIRPQSCRQVGFALQPDGRISGQVIAADGKPAKSVQVAVVPVATGNLEFTSAFSDELGRFEVKELHPGRYLVGVGIQSQVDGASWRSRTYYPGVRDRNLAVTIDLGWAEKRTNIDFQLRSATP